MEQFNFVDEEGKKIVYYKWKSHNSDVKGIVQIAHGMEERAKRYDYFAKRLNKAGYIVYANDHRGHGFTAKNKENLGYIADEDGFNWMVKDMKQLTDIIKGENPSQPVILVGHSMGSFLSQRYVEKYGNNIDYLILSGTNGKPNRITKLGVLISKHEIRKHGRKHLSTVMEKLGIGGYNKNFFPCRTNADWISSDEKVVDKFIADEYCGFTSTSSFYYDFIKGLWEIHEKNNLEKIPKQLPIYMFSGDKDPVGNQGKGVISLYNTLIKIGLHDVSYRLYKDGRHEMLNEINKDDVIDDILEWFNMRI
jgi:alpha-beta hydrolase superfamily lysophospholipase